ncbi:twin-arginine translocase TatA/TatE family subunit [Iamia sp. SCSIO 61187]|uniref:twin-arginine translocase TatA/TatE family subunit n=1 Tax=Iamia sp. SCSIO 61187 TaxID=2722752 RepID=UPI001C636892|nr:twin-arginine translocase TatA/TatE family subunit [Iamia sp. SCSIO 61187]QYG95119.1 twin-arginine translocase TatA/TatE family subunit [Iamia sp. SCSIO 61187]
MNLGAPELAILLVVVLVLFGGAKLPQLARSLGEARRELEAATGERPASAPAGHSPVDPL